MIPAPFTIEYARTCANAQRRDMIRRARLTEDELATAAARFGIVADPDALPLNTSRRSLVVTVDELHPDPDTDGIVRERMRQEATTRMHEAVACWSAYLTAARDARAAGLR
jgi:hypothetical protein